jgi:hypothetical protein
MAKPDAEVLEALKRIPLLAYTPAAGIAAERLGGLTNRNYKITASDQRYVLRIPGDKTGDYINRKVEAHNARVAAEAGVNAEVLFFDAPRGRCAGCTTRGWPSSSASSCSG